MSQFTRRDAIKGIAVGGTGLAVTGLSASQGERTSVMANDQQTSEIAQAARAFRGQHQPKPLSFDPAKLKGLSEKLIRSHHENNYGGAVKALNAVEQRLEAMMKDKDLPPYVYGDVKREELVRTGSVVLHEQYFANLGGDGKAGGAVLDLIKQWFGSYEQWEAEFKRTSNALGEARDGRCSPTTSTAARCTTTGRGTICTTRLWAARYSSSICTSMRTTWTTARRRRNTLMPLCRTSSGKRSTAGQRSL